MKAELLLEHSPKIYSRVAPKIRRRTIILCRMMYDFACGIAIIDQIKLVTNSASLSLTGNHMTFTGYLPFFNEDVKIGEDKRSSSGRWAVGLDWEVAPNRLKLFHRPDVLRLFSPIFTSSLKNGK